MLLNLIPNTQRQDDLFRDSIERENSNKMMKVLDEMNARYGRDTVQLGSSGTSRHWAMRAENKMPCYTTRWEELPVTDPK